MSVKTAHLLPGGTVVFYANTEGEFAVFLPQVIADYLLLGASCMAPDCDRMYVWLAADLVGLVKVWR